MDFKNETRGFRNNNPGNIRQSHIDWNGESSTDLDPEFEEFESVEYGIRAIFKLLRSYRVLYDCVSVHDIIHRYAPTSENKTVSYIKSVIKHMSHFTAQPIGVFENVHERDLLPELVSAIIYHENGINPFNLGFISACKDID